MVSVHNFDTQLKGLLLIICLYIPFLIASETVSHAYYYNTTADIRQYSKISSIIHSFAFTQAKEIIVNHNDGLISAYDQASGKNIKTIKTSNEEFWELPRTNMHIKDHLLFHYGPNSNLHLYDHYTGAFLSRTSRGDHISTVLPSHSQDTYFCVFNETFNKRHVQKRTIETHQVIAHFSRKKQYCYLSSLNREREIIAMITSSFRKKSKICSFIDTKTMQRLEWFTCSARKILFIPESNFYLLAYSTSIKIRDLKKHDTVCSKNVPHRSCINNVAIDPMGTYVAYVSTDYEKRVSFVHVCDTRTLNELWSERVESVDINFQAIQFNSDGTLLVLGTHEGKLLFFKT